jgi:glycosyltransferase involved in cell wall biosynthesis
MHIAFNATALLSPLTGIGQYAFELAQRLAADSEHATEFFYGLGWSPKVRAAPLSGAGKILPRARRLIPHSYAAWRHVQNWKFQRRMQTKNFDVYHEPNFLPYRFEGPTVVTVHDLSWIRYPQSHPPERVRAMERYFEPGLRRASLVVTDSAFVKQEVIDVFGIDPQRIVPVALGVSSSFRPLAPSATGMFMAQHGLVHGQYLLAVGTLEPRKNLVTTLRAYAGLPENRQRAFPLVIAGLRGWHSETLDRELRPLLASGRVRLMGYLLRDDLAMLTAGAAMLVYPSIYEGFGLPPLEAMACGVPTIVSNVASLPEVVGDTGLLIHPHDQDALREAMLTLIDSPELRASLGLKALGRATQFSWDACARQTVEIYRRALSH